MIVTILAIGFMATGMLFFLGAVVGLVRFPDFYTRMHAAGKGDTLSTLLILAGCALFTLADLSWANLLVAIKIMVIVAFISLTSPTTTHALMKAGYGEGIEPWRKPKADRKDDV